MAKLYYAPSRLNKWESLQAVNMPVPPLKFAGVGQWFMTVYESLEECKADWPENEVLTMHGVEPESEANDE